jgi:hypothetical protein
MDWVFRQLVEFEIRLAICRWVVGFVLTKLVSAPVPPTASSTRHEFSKFLPGREKSQLAGIHAIISHGNRREFARRLAHLGICSSTADDPGQSLAVS